MPVDPDLTDASGRCWSGGCGMCCASPWASPIVHDLRAMGDAVAGAAAPRLGRAAQPTACIAGFADDEAHDTVPRATNGYHGDKTIACTFRVLGRRCVVELTFG